MSASASFAATSSPMATSNTASSSPSPSTTQSQLAPADVQRVAEAVARLIRPDNSQHASGGPQSSIPDPISTGNSTVGTAGNSLEGKSTPLGFLANQ